DIWFQAPSNYQVIVRSPAALADSFMAFEEGTLSLYDPHSRFAVVFKNFLPLSVEDRRTLVDASFDDNVKNFEYQIGGSSKVAGLSVVELKFKAKNEKAVIKSGTSRVHDEYSFPLAGSMTFANGAKYGYEFKKVEFNSTKKRGALVVPSDAIVSEWDLDSKAFSESEASKEAKQAGFDFKLPTLVPAGLKLTKVIRQKGPIAAFTALYRNGAKSLTVMSFKNFGVGEAPRGVKLGAGKIAGRLIPNPHLNTYSFTSGRTSYVLTSNVSIDDLIGVAEQF
ncbi:MAG: hypothetical protein V4760_06245, partial [Bdellovibrionota bacterium]